MTAHLRVGNQRLPRSAALQHGPGNQLPLGLFSLSLSLLWPPGRLVPVIREHVAGRG